MDVQPLLPGTEALACEQVSVDPDRVTLTVRCTARRPRCPCCDQPAHRVHSRYHRTLADLPWPGRPGRLLVQVRRFFCDHAACPRRIFAERLTGVAGVRARLTERLGEAQQRIALSCGGEQGSRLATTLDMPVSADTLLRRVRQLADSPPTEPQVLGVDDWALRRGQRYGTILCDLEQHRPIDLLPERSSQVFRDWLKAHPSVTVISRDRGGDYAKGAAEGAPCAVQVVDRWHLLHNLHEALMCEAERHPQQVMAAAKAMVAELDKPEKAPSAMPIPMPAAFPKPTRAEQRKQANRARRLHRYEQILELHRRGLSLRAIARQLGMSRCTARRFVRAGTFPERADRPTRSRVDPLADQLRQRWDEGCHNAADLFRELQRTGWSGSYHMVRRRVASWRDPTQRHRVSGPNPAVPSPRLKRPSTSHVAWLLMKGRSELTLEEQVLRRTLRAGCPSLKRGAALARWFAHIVRRRRVAALEDWLVHACAVGAPTGVKQFAQGLLADLAPIQAALNLPWSNGQVEGQINRLKLVKRQMYGRANFDLLRKRFLHAG